MNLSPWDPATPNTAARSPTQLHGHGALIVISSRMSSVSEVLLENLEYMAHPHMIALVIAYVVLLLLLGIICRRLGRSARLPTPSPRFVQIGESPASRIDEHATRIVEPHPSRMVDIYARTTGISAAAAEAYRSRL